MKKVIAILLVFCVFLGLTPNSVIALDGSLSADFIAKQLGGVTISIDDVPENVIVLEFSSAGEALDFMELDRRMYIEGMGLSVSQDEIEQNYNDITNSINLSQLNFTYEELSQDNDNGSSLLITDGTDRSYYSSDASYSTMNGVKTASFMVSLFTYVNIFANYTRTKTRYTKINSVTSNMSGLSLGVDWVHDTYSANIISNGKKISTTVYGHFNYYLLIESSFFRIATNNESYSVTWGW